MARPLLTVLMRAFLVLVLAASLVPSWLAGASGVDAADTWQTSDAMTSASLHVESMAKMEALRKPENQNWYCISLWFETITTDTLDGKDSDTAAQFQVLVRSGLRVNWPSLTDSNINGMWLWNSHNATGLFCSLWVADRRVVEDMQRDMGRGTSFTVEAPGGLTLSAKLAGVDPPTEPAGMMTTAAIAGAVAGSCALVLIVAGVLTWQQHSVR